MGKTRPGKTTKRSVISGKRGKPILTKLFSGNLSDFKTALVSVDALPKRPKILSGDKGFDAQWLRNALRKRHIQSAIARRKTSQGKPRRKLTPVAQQRYKQRWKVERAIGWFDGFRRLVIRWERLPIVYQAFTSVAMILILLR